LLDNNFDNYCLASIIIIVIVKISMMVMILIQMKRSVKDMVLSKAHEKKPFQTIASENSLLVNSTHT